MNMCVELLFVLCNWQTAKKKQKNLFKQSKANYFVFTFFSPQKSEVLRMTHLFVLRLLSVLLLSKSGLFLLDSLPTIISPLSFSFSIPPRCALSFYFHWTASRWDNILMALLTGKTPTADFHQRKLETKTIPYCQVEFHSPSRARALSLRVQQKSADSQHRAYQSKILRLSCRGLSVTYVFNQCLVD